MLCSKYLSLLTLVSLTFLQAVVGELGPGRLVVGTPDDPLTCDSTVVQWAWTGSAIDAQANTVSVALEMEGYARRRGMAEPSPIRLVRKRSHAGSRLHSRDDNAINIAGGSGLPMSDGAWTWSSVGVTPGTYRMAISIDGEDVVSYSDPFSVQQGPNTACLGTYGSGAATSVSSSSPTTSASTSSTPSAPTFGATSTAAAASTNTSAASAANTTGVSSKSTTSQDSKTGEKDGGVSGGSIAAGVLVPIIALGLLTWLLCVRRKRSQHSSSLSAVADQWSEKVSGLFAGSARGSPNHRRQISGPLDPVHTAGLAVHDDEVKMSMRQGGNDSAEGVTRAPQDWVDFQNEAKESDAPLVSAERVNEMVRVSMETSDLARAGNFYQQGGNKALRQSLSTEAGNTSMSRSEARSSLPSYLRDADFTSQQTHGSFGQEVNGSPLLNEEGNYVTLDRSSSQHSSNEGVQRSGSKVRRKPVPTYSSMSIGGNAQAASSTSTLAADETESEVRHDPFSDAHEADSASSVHTVGQSDVPHPQHHRQAEGGEMYTSREQEMLTTADEQFELPNRPFARTPPSSSTGSFPASVRSSCVESPGQRVLLSRNETPMTEEERKELYKLSVQLPTDDRGFRISF